MSFEFSYVSRTITDLSIFSGGICRDVIGGYYCVCSEGYAGERCNIFLDPCMVITCFNGGTCRAINRRFVGQCFCRPGFTGQRCETQIDPCKGVVCRNGGTCKNTPAKNGFYCDCTVGYAGEHCETKLNLCDSRPCKNGAICKNYTGSYFCICPSHYEGMTCENSVMLSDKVENNSVRTTPSNTFVEINSMSSSNELDFTRTFLLFFTFCVALLNS